MLLAPALLAALVFTQAFADGSRLVVGAETGGRRRRRPRRLAHRVDRRLRRRRGRGHGGPASAVSAMDELPIRRNTVLLSAALAANSAMLQLSAAVASLTLVIVLGRRGPARARPGDRARLGRARGAAGRPGDGPLRPRAGARRRLLIGAAGCGLAALGSASELGARRARRASCSSAPRAGWRCWRAPRPATCTRPSGARAGSRSCSSARCSARSSGPPCSARCSPAGSSTATRSRRCGSRRAAFMLVGLRARVGGAARPAPDRGAARARAGAGRGRSGGPAARAARAGRA